MNLEYDSEEIDLLTQAGEVFEKIAPIPPVGTWARPDNWSALAQAGWAGLGAEMADGALPLSLAVDLFRRAGAQLLLEDMVTSAFLLSTLTAAIGDAAVRDEMVARLLERPGLLVGDGRTCFLPLVDAAESEGFSYGSPDDCDVYRLVRLTDGLILQRWNGPPPTVRPLADLSCSVSVLTVPDPTGPWVDAPLIWGAVDLDILESQASLLHAAALVGCSEQLLELTCEYARDRVQFGVPIGSFQAVKHLLADVHTGLTVAWNAILSAAAEDADSGLAPLVARLLAVDAALAAARVGAQVHGGMGYTAELNVHLFLKAILDGVIRGGSSDEVAIELGRRFVETTC